MIPKNKHISKGMAFGGCSFTWGQNLWYYSNLPSIVTQKSNNYYPQFVNFTHRAFSESFRYPRLVAKHFNTFELCQPFNGGSNTTILDYWEKTLDNSSTDECYKITHKGYHGPKHRLDDIGTFIFQITNWSRSDITITCKDKTYGPMQRWVLFSENQPLFFEYLDETGLSIERYFLDSKRADLHMIRDFLFKLEAQQIKVYILCWPEDLVEHINQDHWLSQRFIKLNYQNQEFSSIENLMDKHPVMSIQGDTEFFEVPPFDGHPSLKCHRVIADSIISHIEREPK